MENIEQTVFIIDDDKSVRDTLEELASTIDLKAKAFETCRQFLEEYDGSVSGCLVLDVRIPGMSGLQLQAELKSSGYDIPVIFISGHGDVPMAAEAFKMGAVDFIEKPFRNQVLLDQISKALEIDLQSRNKRTSVIRHKEKIDTLSSRELEVLKHILQGKLNKVTASELHLSQRTIEYHRAKIMEKLEVSSIAELVKFSIEAEK